MENKKIETANLLIKDLYIDLRKKVNYWSTITNQTPQARMGYIGQHLVSIVTGYPGGKSGARGYDLVIDTTDKNNIIYGEIKTCYRVDQLGKCNQCSNVVSSLEKECSLCGSKNIKRNDDSKWLISMNQKDDLILTFEPKYYYFVLFEFQDINNPENNNIVATIWRVKTNEPGFLLCMLDYYYNILANCSSNAPFNMWPHMLKFHLTKPIKIYESIIYEDDKIETLLLDNNNTIEDSLLNLENYTGSKNLTVNVINKVYQILNIPLPKNKSKKSLLECLNLQKNKFTNSQLADIISYALYYDNLQPHIEKMPKIIKDKVENSIKNIKK